MAKTYDTAEFRQVASALEECAEDVALELNNSLRWIRDDVPEHLSGSSADALEESVTELHQKISACSKELGDLGKVLRQYAFLLDDADKKAAEMIQSR